MGMPVDLKSVLDAAKGVEEARNMPVSAVVLVDETAPAELIELVETAFEPLSPASAVGYHELGTVAYNADTDFVCIVAGGDRRVGAAAAYAREAGVPVMVVAASAGFVSARAKEQGHAIPQGDLIDGSVPERLAEAMGKWVLAVCKNKKLAAAQAFVFARRPLAVEAIRATSLQNAGIGAVVIIPGADMPVMTLNQIKMLLQIAAAYGQPMDLGRVKELAAVVGGGFAARTVARQLVSLVPVGGWAVKGGIGYSATMAMGYAALNYFEAGGGLKGVGAIANSAGAKAVRQALGRGAGKVAGAASAAGKAAVAGVAGFASAAGKAAATGAGKVAGAARAVVAVPSEKAKAARAARAAAKAAGASVAAGAAGAAEGAEVAEAAEGAEATEAAERYILEVEITEVGADERN